MNQLKIFVTSTLLLISSYTNAALIDVSQGGTFLGQFDSYSGGISGAANYNYFTAENHLVNGPTLAATTGHIFFYEGSDGLFFNSIFDSVATSGPNQRVQWDITVSGSSADPYVAVSDDVGELQETAADFFDANFHYIPRYGDGGVIGGLAGDWSLTIDPVLYQNLNFLKVFDDSGSSIDLAINTTDTIVFSAASAKVPEPSILALFSLGLVGVGFGVRRRLKG